MMEEDLVVQASPLFLCTSKVAVRDCLRLEKDCGCLELRKPRSKSAGNENKYSERIQLAPWDIEQNNLGLILGPNNNNNPKEAMTIVERIKQSSPKFMRKLQNSKSPNDENSQEITTKYSIISRLSPKLPRKIHQDGLGSSKNGSTESKRENPIEDGCNTESGAAKGKKNWSKVKSALKKLTDTRDDIKLDLPFSNLNVRSPSSDSSIPISTENEDAQRLKGGDKKIKLGSPRSPRSKSKFSFWPTSSTGDGNLLSIPSPNGSIQDISCTLPIVASLKKRSKSPIGFRRSSAPDALLRKSIDAFNLSKKAKEAKLRSQIEGKLKEAENKDNVVLSCLSDEEIKERVNDILRDNLRYLEEYIPDVCERLGREISETIVKYLLSIEKPIDSQNKFACLVYIGAVMDDGISAAARALWSPGNDRFIVSDYQNGILHAIGIVLAIPC